MREEGMVASVRPLRSLEARRTRWLLVASTAGYMLLSAAILVYALVAEVDVPLPNRDWSFGAQAAFFAAFLFPAISVLSLMTGWVLYVSSSYLPAAIGALLPWAWGLLAVLCTAGVVFQ
ncbi:MAG: hypothetical protein AAFQ82_12065 [Myxococcota bacterium]